MLLLKRQKHLTDCWPKHETDPDEQILKLENQKTGIAFELAISSFALYDTTTS